MRPSAAAMMQESVERELDSHDVTGAAVGVLHGDETMVVTAGLADRSTGVLVTPATPFLIGSVAKTWTATAVMRLVQAGRVELDEPLVSSLPGLVLATERATATLTLRHLLTHSCGIDEDVVVAGWDEAENSLESYVARLGEVGQLHAPGDLVSYSNSGFALAGLLAQRVVGQRFEDVLRELVFEPLGLRSTSFFGTSRELGGDSTARTATGYRKGWRGQHAEIRARLPRAYSPAGSTVTATVGDVLQFARLHAAHPDDSWATRILGAPARAAMHGPQVLMPWARTEEEGSIGLGWMRTRVGRHDVLYHGGGSLGQQCGLVVVPSAQVAVATLTNEHSCPGFHAAMIDLVLSECLGADSRFDPTEIMCDDPGVDLTRCVGTYRRNSLELRVSAGGAHLRCRVVKRSEDVRLGTGASGLTTALLRLASTRLSPCRESTFRALPSGSQAGGTPFVFSRPDESGKFSYLQVGTSALRRLAS